MPGIGLRHPDETITQTKMIFFTPVINMTSVDHPSERDRPNQAEQNAINYNVYFCPLSCGGERWRINCNESNNRTAQPK